MKDLITALQILLRYSDARKPTFCEHDCLWVMVDPSLVSAEDIKELDELSLFADEDDMCFKSFRFGSC